MPGVTGDLFTMIAHFDLEKVLKEVFPTSPIPSTLFLDDIARRNGDIPTELRQRLFGREWTKVDLNDWCSIGPIDSIKTYITPTAFRYYLPSILLRSIENPSYMELGLEALLPSNNKRVPRGSWWNEYFQGFDSDQKKAVKAYLMYASRLAITGGIAESMIPLAIKTFHVGVDP